MLGYAWQEPRKFDGANTSANKLYILDVSDATKTLFSLSRKRNNIYVKNIVIFAVNVFIEQAKKR